MNNKFGTDGRYREEREPFWRGSEGDRTLRSPDQEFETSGNYREPREPYGQTYTEREPPYYPPVSPGFRNESGYRPAPFAPDYSNARYNQYGRNAAQPPERRGGFSGRGPKGYARTDERIREDICERLSWNDEVDATDIGVHVQNGEVTLEGSVETRHMKRLAEDLAERVPGVTDVHNTVRVKKPILTELKEKLSGEAEQGHYAHTGTKSGSADAPRARS
jgi:hypothetical protein